MIRPALVLIAGVFFISCTNVDTRKATNSETEANSSVAILPPENQVEGLTEEQSRRLDGRIPPKIREILNKAKEITISYNADKNTLRLNVLVDRVETGPNAHIKVADPLKKQFLDSFYSDAASNSNGSACFSPRHRVNAKFKTETVELDICYECEQFRGKSSAGGFGGGLDGQRKSSAVIDAIIEKYRKKIR